MVLDEAVGYTVPEHLPVNQWALGGDWTIERERVVRNRPGGSIAYRFDARDVHLVLDGPAGPIPFRVLLDGNPPGPAHGIDIDEQGYGVLREGRLYQLIRVPDEVRERTVQVVFDDPDARAYVFTFG